MTRQDAPPGPAVRALMRRAERAVLATALGRDGSGWPYGSLVLAALDHDASPLLLISDLADHTANIKADPRVCLFYDGTGGHRDPLAGPRASVLGRAERCDGEGRLLDRFLARHPGARTYAGFADFHLYGIEVVRAHLVAGFGQIHWLEASEVLLDVSGAKALAAAEADIVRHMNEDHADALDAIATSGLGGAGSGWVMTGLDPEGFDLRRGANVARACFEGIVQDAEAARAELVRLTKQARRMAPR